MIKTNLLHSVRRLLQKHTLLPHEDGYKYNNIKNKHVEYVDSNLIVTINEDQHIKLGIFKPQLRT